jgi:PAS domain S-box-containing protein
MRFMLSVLGNYPSHKVTMFTKRQTLHDLESDFGTLKLADIIDTRELLTLMKAFCRLTGIGICVLDTEGRILIEVGRQELCSNFHRSHPDSLKNCLANETMLSYSLPIGTVKSYLCANNLPGLLTPIVIGGRHMGNVCLSQFFYDDEPPDLELFRNQAQKYGFDEVAYLAALARLPRLSRKQVSATMTFCTCLARLISTLSYNSVILSRVLAEKNAALHLLDESRTFQTSLLENVPIPVFAKDTAGRYLLCNSAYKIFLGKADAQIIGADTFAVHPQDLAKFYHDMDNELFLNGQPQAYETKLLNASGDLRDGIVHKALLTNADGATIGLVGAILDITDRIRAEEENKQLQAQLLQAQKMEAIGTLAGGIAHDFNNILGAILGYAEMVRETSPAGSTTAHDLDQILLACNRAKELVMQILTFSRQATTERIPLQPALIVKEAIKFLRASLPATITIVSAIDPKTAPILADPTQIHQLTLNLCTNAFHAMEEHGGTLSISLDNLSSDRKDRQGAAEGPKELIHLSVKDTGPGIPLEIQDKIFDPYFTTKEVGKGTGMGLAIVHGIVASYGGTISCESRLGLGTTFHITIPALKESAESPDQSGEPTNISDLGAERILFIDDEELLLNMTQTMLQGLGYQVTIRRSSLEALSSFQNQPDAYDLVITDQTMPGMTGIDLARRMLQIRPNLPIILCTGFSSRITEEKAKAAGIKGFACKPLAKREIANLIRQVLNKPVILL